MREEEMETVRTDNQRMRGNCQGKWGPKKFLFFVSLYFSLFFKARKNNGMFDIDVKNLVRTKS